MAVKRGKLLSLSTTNSKSSPTVASDTSLRHGGLTEYQIESFGRKPNIIIVFLLLYLSYYGAPVFFKITDGITKRLVPLRKQGKGPGRNCQNRLLEKLLTSRFCVGVYKHTGKVEYYTSYKEALNLATTEIRTCKRT